MHLRLGGGGFHIFQDAIQVGTREVTSAQYHGRNFLRVADVVEGVGVEHDEVSQFARFHRT
jgi:hypothetical protein